MLLFDGLNGTFRKIKLRERKPTCVVCGDNPSVTVLQDYEQFCGSTASDTVRFVVVLRILLPYQKKARGGYLILLVT